MNKYYAVKDGKNTGIFNSWQECESNVKGYKGAQYKSFKTLKEAEDYLHNITPVTNDHLVAYTDGSYNQSTQTYGYGCVLIEHSKIVAEYFGKGTDKEHSKMRNVSGEIMGAMKAVSYAIEHHYKDIDIYYDYEGIEKWATRLWQANKPGTLQYVNFIEDASQSIHIHFYKVKAHSGNEYNEAADLLAKKAVGI